MQDPVQTQTPLQAKTEKGDTVIDGYSLNGTISSLKELGFPPTHLTLESDDDHTKVSNDSYYYINARLSGMLQYAKVVHMQLLNSTASIRNTKARIAVRRMCGSVNHDIKVLQDLMKAVDTFFKPTTTT